MHARKEKCNCSKKKNIRNCGTCSKIYDKIISEHRFGDPNWITDASAWGNDHWQIAKCFMTTANIRSNNTAAETDAAGLLSIIINGLFFQSEINCGIDPPNDYFSQVREMRNEILHNSTLELTDNDVNRYLQAMIGVLEDKKTLINDSAAQAAVDNLKKIISDELIITTKEEAKVRQSAMDAIREFKEQSEEQLKKLSEEIQNNMKENQKIHEKKIRETVKEECSTLQQQKIEYVNEITLAKQESLDTVKSTISSEIDKRVEPEMKRIDNLEHRLEAVEKDQRDLRMKQLNLEKQVELLDAAEKKHQTRIEYLRQKQGLQMYLVDLYQKHYVKTSLSPMMTHQDDVDISDVYVSPKMVVVDTSGETTDSTGNERPIKMYQDMFCTNEKQNTRIYVVGEVGTGKSSFCKWTIKNWCRSFDDRRNVRDSSGMEEQNITQNELNSACCLNQFDFLFYIHLRVMAGYTNDLTEMIKAQFKDYKSLIEEIFANDSERCLILADGLDEWKPTETTLPFPQHHTFGIPASGSAREATIITTSRPSCPGMLNMKSSEYDLKVTISGLEDSFVKSVIEKYMKLLDRTSLVPDFISAFLGRTIEDMKKTPMLLQQIIWLYCKGYDLIGKSTCYLYSHIVNVVFAWVNEKNETVITLPDFRNSPMGQIPLPKCFEKFDRCQENRTLILLLGEVAFETYIIGKSTSVGRSKLKEKGLSDTDISAVVKTGILTEENCADPTFHKSQISFTHTSFLEFFAAVYMSSCYLQQIHDANSIIITPLEDIITSVDEILRLGDVLINMCGLAPFLTERISECVYIVTSRDESVDAYTIVLYTDIKVVQIQNLIFSCLSEHYSMNPNTLVKAKLCHFININPRYMALTLCHPSVNPSTLVTCHIGNRVLSHAHCLYFQSFLSQAVSLRSLYLHAFGCLGGGGHCIDLSNCKQLECLTLWRCCQIGVFKVHPASFRSCRIVGCAIMSQEHYVLLLSCLSQAVSLRHLRWEGDIVEHSDCEGHRLDLANHKLLQTLILSSCNVTFDSVPHSIYLEVCSIKGIRLPHEKWLSFSSCLLQAVSLKSIRLRDAKCTMTGCSGHCIDLSNQNLLQDICLYECYQICISGLNPDSPKSCKIEYCKISCEQFSLLSTCLSQTPSLTNIILNHIKCARDGCEGHRIDLSNHRQLKNVQLSNAYMYIRGVSPMFSGKCMIEFCKLTHEQYSLLASFLSHAISLTDITIRSVKCEQNGCEGHGVDLSNHTKLENIDLSYTQLYIFGVNHTFSGRFIVKCCMLTHEQYSLLSSFLSNALSLMHIDLLRVECARNGCEGHDIDLSNHAQLQNISLLSTRMNLLGVHPTFTGRPTIRHWRFM
ncbi:uncharacterized protein LOC128547065 isoform X2 [Mercenaria mercenaria]|nr:uncharacterized protein LOC128547065 isoform X2 [Mercenaria mercenaria]